MNRRKFIGQAGCAALGYSTLLSSLINLKFLNAAAGSALLGGDRDDYKALVCVMLSGGNDAFNMLMPTDSSAYNHYATTRSNLAIPHMDILPLNQQGSANPDLGIHPSMSGLQGLFDDGKMAFLANTGMLVQPTSKSDFYNDNKLPLGLFSHSDQTFQWQTASPHERVTKGWGGKIADLIHDMNQDNGISMNISLAGTNVFQLGNETIEYSLNPYNGATGISGYQPNNPWNEFDNVRTAALDNMIDHDYQNVFEKTYVDVIRNSRNAHQVFQSALESGQEIQTSFSDNYLSQSFKMAARTMSIRDAIGVKRQIFFINFGGWDHHDELLGNQADMLYALNNALTEFQASLEELEIDSQVTTFGISEFGRTLTSNGNGTDHAWGSNVFMVGNHINGTKVYGDYPSLELGNSLEVGNGVLIPTTSADEYFAELALWFGVSRSDLPLIFPNLSNFYNIQSSEMPLGFLNI